MEESTHHGHHHEASRCIRHRRHRSIAASAIIVGGLAAPAQASEPVSPQLTGTSIGNGDDVPVASENDTSVTAPVEAPVTAPAGSGNDVTGGNVGDIGSSVNDTVDGSLGGLDLGAVLGR